MYENLHLNDIGGFGSGYYWSSSELGTGIAWYQRFLNGYQYFNDKYLSLRVRAVRAFY